MSKCNDVIVGTGKLNKSRGRSMPDGARREKLPIKPSNRKRLEMKHAEAQMKDGRVEAIGVKLQEGHSVMKGSWRPEMRDET